MAEYTDLQCASFETADAVYEYLLRELADEEGTPNITARVEKSTVRITYHDLDRFSGERTSWDMQLLGFRDGIEHRESEVNQ
mgnify:CR=1 FL=1